MESKTLLQFPSKGEPAPDPLPAEPSPHAELFAFDPSNGVLAPTRGPERVPNGIQAQENNSTAYYNREVVERRTISDSIYSLQIKRGVAFSELPLAGKSSQLREPVPRPAPLN